MTRAQTRVSHFICVFPSSYVYANLFTWYVQLHIKCLGGSSELPAGDLAPAAATNPNS